MTKQEKQLLLKDLCGRIPYRPIITLYGDGRDKCLLCGVDGEELYLNIDSAPFSFSDFNMKPYLRPMSNMTEEEKKEHDFYCGYKPYDENIGESYLTEYDMPDYIDFLYEHHLDFRGLIEKGLALEAPRDMYKTE